MTRCKLHQYTAKASSKCKKMDLKICGTVTTLDLKFTLFAYFFEEKLSEIQWAQRFLIAHCILLNGLKSHGIIKTQFLMSCVIWTGFWLFILCLVIVSSLTFRLYGKLRFVQDGRYSCFLDIQNLDSCILTTTNSSVL